jgi:hypothetical protein
VKRIRALCGSIFRPSLVANAVRLQLHALAYNLGNFMRTSFDGPLLAVTANCRLLKAGKSTILGPKPPESGEGSESMSSRSARASTARIILCASSFATIVVACRRGNAQEKIRESQKR